MVLNMIKIAVFLFLTGFGIVGNISVFVNCMFIFLVSSEKKSVHLILIHLAFTNILMLSCRGMQKTIEAFGLRNFQDDVGCKTVVYLQRVARGLSICTTSLLTVVQAIAISPRASRWRRLQPRSAWNILPLLIFFWILNAVISINLPFYIKYINIMNISETRKSENYCYFLPEIWIIRSIFLFLMVLRDAGFQGVMGWASGYMVFLLHKHHQHVFYLQTSKLLYRTPPEKKAAQSVLLLMLCFLFFYWTDSFLSFYSTVSSGNNFITVTIQDFLTVGHAILSSFVLIHRDGHLCKSCSVRFEKIKYELNKFFYVF
uniref:Vomeronasal type-1 receptor n=1 Tax=Sciurus vulgaris TaxID=55149 RepID=A0A8D2JMD2_SCIVU